MDSIINAYNMLDNKNYLFQCIFILTFLSFNSCAIIQNGLSVICSGLISAIIVTTIVYPIIIFISPNFMIKHLVFLLILLIIYHIANHIITLIHPKKCIKYYEKINKLINEFMQKIENENKDVLV